MIIITAFQSGDGCLLMNKTEIHSNEILYRRILINKPNIHPNDRRYWWNNELEKFEVLPLAFYHKKNRISVNRANHHNNDPSITQSNLLNGVTKLLAEKIENMNNIDPFKADIEHEPTESNVAHSVITLQPDCNVLDDEYKEHRMCFRQNLADIANSLGWAIEPSR